MQIDSRGFQIKYCGHLIALPQTSAGVPWLDVGLKAILEGMDPDTGRN
jgi:hypothetical protein